jgi:D-lactate dehydrogenase
MRSTDGARIAFFDTKPYDVEYFDAANTTRGFTLKYYPARLNPDTAILARGADAVCAFVNDDIGSATISVLAGMGIRLLALRAAGYNNVDLRAAWGALHVVRVPAYSPYAVAEHTVALALALNRKIHRAFARTRDGNFTITGLVGFDMHGKTAAVIGTGRIGKVVAGIFAGFGMRILVSDPFPDRDWAAASGFEYVGADEAFSSGDLVTLHCPLTPENVHLAGERTLALMKPKAILLNAGRGKLIDTKALIEALKEKRIGGAGLDVYEEEDEYFFEDFSSLGIDDDVLARLLSFPNVIVTSHQAFLTEEALSEIAETTLGNVGLYLGKGELPNEICYHCSQGECVRKTTGKCFKVTGEE